jgi:hypothetical protein
MMFIPRNVTKHLSIGTPTLASRDITHFFLLRIEGRAFSYSNIPVTCG